MNAPARRSRKTARAARWLVVVMTISAVALPALADAPVLHEYVPIDPQSDGELGAVTVEGGLAAELVTPSGKITAPDVGRPIDDKTPTYADRAAVPDSWTPDRDTRRPDTLKYDDPFRPRLAPFKRAIALDTVDASYTLHVRDPRHRIVDLATPKLPPTPLDPFYADIALDARTGDAIRIPGVVGGAAIVKASVTGSTPFRLEQDSAENWFVVPEGTGKMRLVLEIQASRFAFGGVNTGLDWSDMKTALLPKLPTNVQAAAEKVAKDLGIDPKFERPYQAIERMVGYFRGFAESETPPASSGDIYLDLVASKKGVCRHRAFAFMVTALGLGIPARFVQNEAHAWVEVHDGEMWRRIDLGGAGQLLDDKSEPNEHPEPSHLSPADPYAWPSSSHRGQDMLPPAPTPGSPSGGSGSTSGGTSDPPSTPPPATSSSSKPELPPGKLSLNVEGWDPTGKSAAPELLRKTLTVRGRFVDATGAPCKGQSVHVRLRRIGDGRSRAVEPPLVTDDGGNYEGKVTLPSDLDLGDYEVTTHVDGNKVCGPGDSE
jgi:hypothetical protein